LLQTIIMKKKCLKIVVVLALFFVYSCATKPTLIINYSNPEINYSGRVDSSKSKAVDLYWSSTSIKINFEGNEIHALLEDEKGENYYNVIIDNDSLFILHPDTSKRYHLLASKLSKGKHTIEIFKRTEWSRGKTSFYGFKINGNSKLLPKEAPKKRKMEFYGNSITAGYAVEDFSGKDSPDSTYTNSYRSYAALTARHFNAKQHSICKGGIGITISWFPLTMPEMYNRLIPEDSTSLWDFSLYTPDIVVVNLLQNDSWLVNKPERNDFKKTFGKQPPTDLFIINSYAKFIQSIRQKYPTTHIICILGNMDATRKGSKWPLYIKSAVATLDDPKIYTHFIPYKDSPGHPTVKEQEDIANSLIQFIDTTIKW